METPTCPKSEPVVVTRDLTKIFDAGPTQVRAVDHVNLHACRGELVLIMGPSGSGKTTLLSMLGGLLRPTSGSIMIGNHDVASMEEAERTRFRREWIGFIFQSFNLLPSLTAVENVEVALNLAGVSGQPAREKATSLLTGLGLGSRITFKPDVLSGGEKQRISIARALANDPAVILADEPTANLDSVYGRLVVNQLREIAKEQQRTVIIVSHDERIRAHSDRVIWLEDGRILPAGRDAETGSEAKSAG
jgi:putative ABC transport system ATP-binding protein